MICSKCSSSDSKIYYNKTNVKPLICVKCYQREIYLKNRDKRLNYTKNYRQKHPRVKGDNRFYIRIKNEAMDKCGGRFCINCGQTDIRVLEFNYIGGGHSELVKRNKLPKGCNLLYALKRGSVNPNRFNILCKVCNHAEVCERLYGLKYEITPTIH